MGNLKRCLCCKGSKRLIGMGMIEKDCPECKAVGWIEEKDEVDKTPEAKKFDQLGEVSVVYKKRGPKKGYKKLVKDEVKNEFV